MKRSEELEIARRIIVGSLKKIQDELQELDLKYGMFESAWDAVGKALAEVNDSFKTAIYFWESFEAMDSHPEKGKGAYGPGLVDPRYTGD